MKKIILIFVVIISTIILCACGEDVEATKYSQIKFSDMYETKGTQKNVSTFMKNLDGKNVQITGYPAIQSPLDQSFIYLTNQPYVTCPFCTIGDITKLEVIPIFMANGGKIQYSENALNISGKLEVAEKKDSEQYTTQFRIYADKVEEVVDTGANKAVNDYYSTLTKEGMIYDIQILQMSVEYATNPKTLLYYDEKLQTGQSSTIDVVSCIKAIANEYIGFDSQYANGYGSDYTYYDYIVECPFIVKELEPADVKLKVLNDELIQIYNDEIKILQKYRDICYAVYEIQDTLTLEQAANYESELNALNEENLKLYNQFTAWNNKLREQ